MTHSTRRLSAWTLLFLSAGVFAPGCDSGDAADSGISLSDAAPLVDAGSDAGSDGGVCGSQVPVLAVDQCGASTQACWSNCRDMGCVDSCIGADPNPGCAECFGRNETACVVNAGCEAQWAALDCCREAQCPEEDFEVPACLNDACASEHIAFLNCGSLAVGQSGCATAVIQCF